MHGPHNIDKMNVNWDRKVQTCVKTVGSTDMLILLIHVNNSKHGQQLIQLVHCLRHLKII